MRFPRPHALTRAPPPFEPSLAQLARSRTSLGVANDAALTHVVAFVIGLLMLVGYVVVARIFWFTAPLIAASAAAFLYGIAFVFIMFTRF